MVQKIGMGFFFSILWCNNTGNHPQEEFAKCGYKSERKVKLKNPTMLRWLAGTYCVSMAISEEKHSSKSGDFDESFRQKNPLYVWVTLDFLFVTKWWKFAKKLLGVAWILSCISTHIIKNNSISVIDMVCPNQWYEEVFQGCIQEFGFWVDEVKWNSLGKRGK